MFAMKKRVERPTPNCHRKIISQQARLPEEIIPLLNSFIPK
jgi:hypothetical protein